MSIPKEVLDQIHEAAEIADVVGDFVTLKKKGNSYSACCPFHNEKTPSFVVTPAKGIYKCFGCGKAGDSVQFVMDMEGLGYIEAMQYLAKKYNIEVPDGSPLRPDQLSADTERESLLIALNFAKNYFQDILNNNDEGKSIGYSYFKERGFSDPTIRKFELGYSLSEWEALTKTALQSNFSSKTLEKAGLIVVKENANDKKAERYYDRFRGRVIFPIHNVTGKVIAFGARILKSDKNQPKYLNSPESEVYHKSKILYGIYQAKNAIRNENNCFLVEGYTDVISLHQGGIENVVASSGTSLTEDQIRLISRYTDNITVLYDGDAAGIKASIRGTDMILEQGMNVNVVVFPQGEDPDSYIRKIGGTEFKNYIKSAKKDFITFKTELFLRETGNDPIKKAEVIREIVVSISKIPDAIKRAVFFKQCSNVLDIDEQTLISEYNKIVLRKNQEGKKDQLSDPFVPPPDDLFALPPDDLFVPQEELKSGAVTVLEEHEKEIIRILVNYGHLLVDEYKKLHEYILEEVEDITFVHPLYSRIIEITKNLQAESVEITEDYFLKYPEDNVRNLSIDLSTSRYSLSTNWESKYKIFITSEKENLIGLAFSAILRLKWRNIGMLIDETQKNIRHAQDTRNEEEEMNQLRVYIQLKEMHSQLSKMMGNVISK